MIQGIHYYLYYTIACKDQWQIQKSPHACGGGGRKGGVPTPQSLHTLIAFYRGIYIYMQHGNTLHAWISDGSRISARLEEASGYQHTGLHIH